MRRSVLSLCALVACGVDLDESPPMLVGADFVDGATTSSLSVADPAAPLAQPLVEVPTTGAVHLFFSELLDGDAVQTVVRDERDTVVALTGRSGIVHVAPADGSVIDERVEYHSAHKSIHVALQAPLPAATPTLIHLMAERIRDKEGNVMRAAVSSTGEAIRDTDGRGIAATVALVTEAIRVTHVAIPPFGQPDDPETPDVDETVPYDAPITITFNTAMDPQSAADHVHLVGAANIAMSVESSEDPNTLVASPQTTLAPSTRYELLVEDGVSDIYGVALEGGPFLFSFETS